MDKKLSPEQIEKMKQDIEDCKYHRRPKKSQNLLSEVIARWKDIYPSIFNCIKINGKPAAWGYEGDYRPELHYVATLLEQKLSELENEENNPIVDSERAKEIKSPTKKVFIVHGHDDAAKQEVARILERAGLTPIILHEQPDRGQTIIEKLESCTDAAYAIILYTPCDLGRSKESTEEKARARQNVVLEHGYLLCKLGRERVAALVKDQVEMPGDIDGIVYIPMDNGGGWKIKLANNMKTVGLELDLNLLI